MSVVYAASALPVLSAPFVVFVLKRQTGMSVLLMLKEPETGQ